MHTLRETHEHIPGFQNFGVKAMVEGWCALIRIKGALQLEKVSLVWLVCLTPIP